MSTSTPPAAEVHCCGTQSVVLATSATKSLLTSVKRPFAEGLIGPERGGGDDVRAERRRINLPQPSPFKAADSIGVSSMNITELTARDTAVKKHVVEQLGHRDLNSGLYQVWQPTPWRWLDAMGRRREDPSRKGCLLTYLEFPRDYCLVALAVGKSVARVYASMNHYDEAADSQNVIQLAHHLRSGSPGDVIVPPEGDPRFVADYGYVSLTQALTN